MIYGKRHLARCNCFSGAGTNAASAVNASFGIDNADFAYFCDCFYRACGNAGFAANAFCLVNNVCHDNFSLVSIVWLIVSPLLMPSTLIYSDKYTINRYQLQAAQNSSECESRVGRKKQFLSPTRRGVETPGALVRAPPCFAWKTVKKVRQIQSHETFYEVSCPMLQLEFFYPAIEHWDDEHGHEFQRHATKGGYGHGDHDVTATAGGS